MSFWVNVLNTAIEIGKHVNKNPPLFRWLQSTTHNEGVINILCTGVESVTLQLYTLLKYTGNKR